MMKQLQAAWQDIKAGRNIDIYVTVAVAVVVAVLHVLHVAGTEHVCAAILATLALVSHSLLQDRRKTQAPFTISADPSANTQHLLEYIATHQIRKARLIQYSGDKAEEVVGLLLRRGVKVQMLLADSPRSYRQQATGMCEYQQRKMEHFLEKVAHGFENRPNLEIKYYAGPASVRAVKLDNSFLSMGWYTYRDKDGVANTPWLYGHNNATINIRLAYAEAGDLEATFDKVFDALWPVASGCPASV